MNQKPESNTIDAESETFFPRRTRFRLVKRFSDKVKKNVLKIPNAFEQTREWMSMLMTQSYGGDCRAVVPWCAER